MARIASKAKAGFYATPESVLGHIKKALKIEGRANFLDPCCGEGKALANLADGLEAVTYGIELDKKRALTAKSLLDHLLYGDALTEVSCSRGVFELLFLNPPYDWLKKDNAKSERMEYAFLRRFLYQLTTTGTLIFVIPYHVLIQCCGILARNFSPIKIYVFPDEEYQAFHQCVVVGRRNLKIPPETVKGLRAKLFAYGRLEPEEFQKTFPPTSFMDEIRLEGKARLVSLFRSERIDPDVWYPVVRKKSLVDTVLKQNVPRELTVIRSLAPLQNAHLALTLASGYLDGEIADENERLVIRGIIQKDKAVNRVDQRTNSKDEKYSLVRVREHYVLQIKVLDLKAGELFEIK